MFHYFDNAATTPVRPEAVQAAVEAMTQGWGNPSSQYALGKQAAERMKDKYTQQGCVVSYKPPPHGKDWNEYLQHRQKCRRNER